MLYRFGIIKVTLILGIICWASSCGIDLLLIYDSLGLETCNTPSADSNFLFGVYIIFIFTCSKYVVGYADSSNLFEIIKKGLYYTGIALIIFLCLHILYNFLFNAVFSQNILVVNLYHHTFYGFVIAFLSGIYVTFMRLILYQESKILRICWGVYEFFLISLVFFDFVFLSPLNKIYSPINSVTIVMVLTMVAYSLTIAVNIKWVAYIAFREKIKSLFILVLVVVTVGSVTYLLYLYPLENRLLRNTLDSLFLLSTLGFTICYATYSILAIIFSLSTTTIFARKLKEGENFLRLSRMTAFDEKEENIYDILLSTTVNSTGADAAWLEIDDNNLVSASLTYKMNQAVINSISNVANGSKVKFINKDKVTKKGHLIKLYKNLKSSRFGSMLQYPIIVSNEKIGTLSLLKKLKYSFGEETINVADAFVNQASTAVENFRLVKEAIENERYKEELKIATKVQQQLLPAHIDNASFYEISALSETANVVGGDYYDIYEIDEQRTFLIIGDVSGKGTSAAFNMSQMKGVFQSLIQLDLRPGEFLRHANKTLKRCYDEASYVTATIFELDGNSRAMTFARAGHCPTIIYDSQSQAIKVIKGKGLGLGIISGDVYDSYIEEVEYSFNKGDVMLLYTDGIIETFNKRKEQFGVDRLENILLDNAKKSVDTIQKTIIDELHAFNGNNDIKDDYTLLIIKFK